LWNRKPANLAAAALGTAVKPHAKVRLKLPPSRSPHFKTRSDRADRRIRSLRNLPHAQDEPRPFPAITAICLQKITALGGLTEWDNHHEGHFLVALLHGLTIGAKLRSNQARFRQSGEWYTWSTRVETNGFLHFEYAQIFSAGASLRFRALAFARWSGQQCFVRGFSGVNSLPQGGYAQSTLTEAS
jgi:hypothetical protein